MRVFGSKYSDSDVVSRSFALVIYEKDKKRLLWEGYYLDDDLVYNASHPASMELDRVIYIYMPPRVSIEKRKIKKV